MPLARIFTHHPERATSLSEELQQQGYQVEVRNPDQIHLAPADLEIEFEVCDRADVLERAASLADELQADVAVAPGVLQPARQSAAESLPAETARPQDLTSHDAKFPETRPIEVVPVEVAADDQRCSRKSLRPCGPSRWFSLSMNPPLARKRPSLPRWKRRPDRPIRCRIWRN
jgi:hypothetical protein